MPEYDTALKRIFEKVENPKTLINFFNDLVGYVIQPRRDMALIVLMIGKGNNGKTSLVRLLMELVGTGFVTPVASMNSTMYALQSVISLANFCSSTMTFEPAPSSLTVH
jgi:phage/plasmid-associated DNA primase